MTFIRVENELLIAVNSHLTSVMYLTEDYKAPFDLENSVALAGLVLVLSDRIGCVV